MNWMLILGIGIGMVICWLVEKIYNLLKCEHEWVEIPATEYVGLSKDGYITKRTVLTYCNKCYKTKKLIRKDNNVL